jgi:hypothetical protein
MEVNGQLHAPAALPPGKEPLVPIGYEAEWSQSRSGRGGEEKNSQPPPVDSVKNKLVRYKHDIIYIYICVYIYILLAGWKKSDTQSNSSIIGLSEEGQDYLIETIRLIK